MTDFAVEERLFCSCACEDILSTHTKLRAVLGTS
jgi:hypothetical protein